MNNLGEIALNAIHIIESIEDGEYKSGKILFEDIRHLSFKYDYLNIHYYEANDQQDLKHIISKIYQRSKKGEYPIIHFETAHGSKEKFVLKNGDYSPWNKLLKLVQPINVQTRMRLLVSVGACNSVFLLAHLDNLINDHAPCLGTIGSNGLVSGHDLSSQYTLFYQNLIKTEDLEKTYKILKEKYLDQDSRLIFVHAPLIFQKGLKEAFLKRYLSKNFEINVDRLTDIIISKKDKVHPAYQNKSDKEIRELVAIGSHLQKEINPKKYAHKFFMCDLYPEHYKMFDVQKIVDEIINEY